jgi:heat shock protein HspQ
MRQRPACFAFVQAYIRLMDKHMDKTTFFSPTAGRRISTPRAAQARFTIGDVVCHRSFDFRGVVFDVDPVFANSEEWYQSIPEDLRPNREQPYYHLFAENGEDSYIAYVSQQNLVADTEGAPVEHPEPLRLRA